MSRLRACLAVVLLALPGCYLTFHDQAGVPVRDDLLPELHPGATTRGEVLALLGPPTGTFDTDLLATVTRIGTTFETPQTPGRVDQEAFTWQQIDIEVTVFGFPVLFLWGRGDITSRTLTVFFDEHDRVRDVAFREDRP